jgi:hypothetical protein
MPKTIVKNETIYTLQPNGLYLPKPKYADMRQALVEGHTPSQLFVAVPLSQLTR